MKSALLLLCFFSFLSQASEESFDKLFERKSISCEQNGIKWSLSLRARTEKPDPRMDEKNLGYSHLFLVGKTKHLIAYVPLSTQDTYAEGQFTFTNQGGTCAGTRSFLVNPSVVAIIFQQNPIVGPVIPYVLFYDFKNDLILGPAVNLGRGDILSAPFANGLLYHPLVNRSEAAADMPMVLNKKNFVWSDHDLLAVKSVTLNKGKVENRFELDLSWKLSPWGRFFKTKDSFFKASGWNSKKSEFTNNFVFYARGMDEECILLVPHQSFSDSTALAKQKGWLCQKVRGTL